MMAMIICPLWGHCIRCATVAVISLWLRAIYRGLCP